MTTPDIRPSTFNGVLMEATGDYAPVAEDIKVLAQITGHWVGEDTPVADLREAIEEGRRQGILSPSEWSTMRMVTSLAGDANRRIRNMRC